MESALSYFLSLLLAMVPMEDLPECADTHEAFTVSTNDEEPVGKGHVLTELVSRARGLLLGGPPLEGMFGCAGAALAYGLTRYVLLEEDLESSECHQVTYLVSGRHFCADFVEAAAEGDEEDNFWRSISAGQCMDILRDTEVRAVVKAGEEEGELDMDLLVGPARARAFSLTLRSSEVAVSLDLEGALESLLHLLDHGLGEDLREELADEMPLVRGVIEQPELRKSPPPLRGLMRLGLEIPADPDEGVVLFVGNTEPFNIDSDLVRVAMDAAPGLLRIYLSSGPDRSSISFDAPAMDFTYPLLPLLEEGSYFSRLAGAFLEMEEVVDEWSLDERPLNRVRAGPISGGADVERHEPHLEHSVEFSDLRLNGAGALEMAVELLLAPADPSEERTSHEVLRFLIEPDGEEPWSAGFSRGGVDWRKERTYRLPPMTMSIQTRLMEALPSNQYDTYIEDIRAQLYFRDWMNVDDGLAVTIAGGAGGGPARMVRHDYSPAVFGRESGSPDWRRVEERLQVLEGSVDVEVAPGLPPVPATFSIGAEAPEPQCIFVSAEEEAADHLSAHWIAGACAIPEILTFEGSSDEGALAELTWEAVMVDGCEVSNTLPDTWVLEPSWTDGIIRDASNPFLSALWEPTRLSLLCYKQEVVDQLGEGVDSLLQGGIHLPRPVPFSLQLSSDSEFASLDEWTTITVRVEENPDGSEPVAGAEVTLRTLDADGFDPDDERCLTSRWCVVTTDENGEASVRFKLLEGGDAWVIDLIAYRGRRQAFYFLFID